MAKKDQSKVGVRQKAIEREIAETTSDELIPSIVHNKADLVHGPNAGELYETQDEKRSYISHSVADMLAFWNQPKVKNSAEAQERIIAYFARCAQNGTRPLVEEMALALGVTRNMLWQWEQGIVKTVDSDLIKRAKEFIAAFDARAVSDNKLNPVTYIFRSKNYYGLKDQQDVVVTPKQLNDIPKESLIAQAEELPE